MIDTIKIACQIKQMPTPGSLRVLGWRKYYDEFTGKWLGWCHHKKGSKFPFIYLFTAPDGKTYLSVRVSLPAFMFGSNVRLLNQKEVERGMDKLSEYVSERIGFEFNARTAIVWEVHFTKDYYVGEYLMRQVISRLAEMNIPRFNKGGYSETTLYFHSKGQGREENKPRTICIYSKQDDCKKKSFSKDDIQQAEGMLRTEFRYKTPDTVRRLVNAFPLPNAKAQTIFTQVVSDTVLAPIERQILFLLEENDAQSRIISLTQRYGKRRSATLIQFLIYQYLFGRDFHRIKLLNFSRSAYYECQKDCREIGIHYLLDTPKWKIQVGDVL